jgi:hypothetical protein
MIDLKIIASRVAQNKKASMIHDVGYDASYGVDDSSLLTHNNYDYDDFENFDDREKV